MTESLLPTVVTPALLDTLRGQENLPDDVWYFVVGATLCILNRPEEIQTVYKHAVARCQSRRGGQDGVSLPADAEHEELRIARRLREALLKTSAIGGMPKVSPKKKKKGNNSKEAQPLAASGDIT